MCLLADWAAKSLERLAWVVAAPHPPLDSWSRQCSWSRHACWGQDSCLQMPVLTQGGWRDLDVPGSGVWTAVPGQPPRLCLPDGDGVPSMWQWYECHR